VEVHQRGNGRVARMPVTKRTITIGGDPVPAPRPRVTMNGTYMPDVYVAHKNALGWVFKAEVKTPMAGPLVVTLEFHRKNRRRVDLDNLEKTVLDAGNGILWEDDSQIMEMHSRKFLGCDYPRVEVMLEEVEG